MKENLLNQEKEILTRKEVMSMLDVSYVTMYNWAKQNIVREHKLGRSVFYLKDELIEDLKSNGSSLRKSHRG